MSTISKVFLGIIILGAIVLIGWRFLGRSDQEQTPEKITISGKTYSFGNPKKSAHFESNTPNHGVIVAGIPINVVIDFNFDLASPSSISIKLDDTEYGTGETEIDNNKLSMRREMNPNSPDGLYDVSYNACWPDGSCHDGNFQFAIDKSLSQSYKDMRGQNEVTISMKNTQFNPQNIIISKNTKVIWVQEENVEHFVNSDSHPAHTYFSAQNSRGLKASETFELTFEKPGIYPYHCSAHAATMIGNILVE